MQSLIDGLEVTRESYSSIAKPMRNKSPPSESSYNGSILSEDQESPKAKAKTAVKKTTKAMKVQFASLEITPVNKTRGNQHSIAVGLRSSGNTSVPSSSQPTMTISLDRQIDKDSSDGVASVIVFSPENNKGDEDETEFPFYHQSQSNTNRPP